MLISPAYAQGGLGISSDLMSFIPLILIGVVFYFFLIRPQQKKAQQHREMLVALRRGDKIVTNGGLIGTIIKVVNEREVQVEIAENVKVRIIRGMIADILAKTEPQKEIDDKEVEKQETLEKTGSKPVTKSIAQKVSAVKKTGAPKVLAKAAPAKKPKGK